jgi:hypothetical protein
VFSTCPDTFLAVISALQFCEIGIGIDGSEKNGFILGVLLDIWRATDEEVHMPDSCLHWQRGELGHHTGWWTKKARMYGPLSESNQKMLDESVLQKEEHSVR